MPSKIHYEDDLFFLHSILRTLESGLRLDIDADFFSDKVLEDVFFIDATLMRLFSSLTDNPYLINRASYLRSLRRTVVAFSDFLEQFADGSLGMRDLTESYHERLTSARQTYQKVRRDIDQILDQDSSDEESSSLVSTQEYDFLLAADSDGEDAGDDAVGG